MGDQVEEWKRSARRQMARSLPSRGARPQMSIRVTAGFLLLCAAVGLRLRPWGPLFTLAALSSMVLVHEFARALAARAFGRGSKTTISAIGVSNEYSCSPPRGPAALATEIAGALANLLCASDCLWALRVGVRGDAHIAHRGPLRVGQCFRRHDLDRDPLRRVSAHRAVVSPRRGARCPRSCA